MALNLKRFLFIGISVFTLSGCVQNKQQKPIVSVTILPQQYFAEKIAGDKFEIHTVVPNGSSPESYDPSPASLVNLSNSVAYFKIGYIGFELAWMDKLQHNAPEMKIFDTSKGIDLLVNEQHQCNNPAHHHEIEGGIDPHTWTSPANAEVIASNMRDAFIELDPKNRDYYEKNYAELLTEIHATRDSIASILKDNVGESFVIYHPSLTYLADEYGLHQFAIENQGKEPSAAFLKTLIDSVGNRNVKVIFIQQEFDEKNARLIAEEVGAKVVPINPLNYEWSKELIEIANALNEK